MKHPNTPLTPAERFPDGQLVRVVSASAGVSYGGAVGQEGRVKGKVIVPSIEDLPYVFVVLTNADLATRNWYIYLHDLETA